MGHRSGGLDSRVVATSPRPIGNVGAIVIVGIAGAGLAVLGYVRLSNSLDEEVLDVTGGIIGGLIIAVGLGLVVLAVRQLRRLRKRRASSA